MAALDDRQKRELQQEVERQTQEIQGISQQEQQELAQNWADQVTDGRGKYADFDQVIGSVPPNVFDDRMARVIASSDVGADVAYWLGTNKAEAARISQMSDMDMARHIGAIEARVSAPPVKIQSTAPDPVTPVRPKGTAQKHPKNITFTKFNK